jgi:hypothetical protein
MYLLHFHFDNACENGNGELCFKRDADHVAKWTFFNAGKPGLELLRLIAVACGGVRLFSHLPFALQALSRNSDQTLQLEYAAALHPPYEIGPGVGALWGSGVRVDTTGQVASLGRHDYRLLSPETPTNRAKHGTGHSWLFILGYGTGLTHHQATDDFDFNNPFFRVAHFHSLFHDAAPLTDPVEFLTIIQYRGVKKRRNAPFHVLERFARLFHEHLAVRSENWLTKECDFKEQWAALESWQRRAILPIIDAARHLLFGFQKHVAPLDIPFVLLFDRPDLCCTGDHFPRWLALMHAVFPAMQVLATVGSTARRRIPAELAAASHPIPQLTDAPIKTASRLPRGTILLLDVDSKLPNLALMKLSRYFKDQGKNVVLAKPNTPLRRVELVYASCVFNYSSSQRSVLRLQNFYGDALVVGGSGVDIRKRLPEAIEQGMADYSLYPELDDCGIGFLTRGCPFHCAFCIVPTKEGRTRQVATLDDLLPDGRKKLILLDDNILSHPQAGDFLEQMAVRDLKVNFTQTLDLRLLDQQKIDLLKRIHCSNRRFTRRVFHFSMNDDRNMNLLRRKYAMFGFTRRDNVQFICMYGFNTTLAQDVARFRFLRSLPGAYVFVQEYMPIDGGPPAAVSNFFDDRADQLIDELITIMFTQNMKNMEKYYRWVSQRYALAFGKLHLALVDTIFRYNHREDKGSYVAAMTDLIKSRTL